MNPRARNPTHRYRAVKDAAEAPEHPFEGALWNLLHDQAGDNHVAYALELFAGDTENEIMQAWLLANATDAQVKQYLRIPEEVTRAYRHLFFDIAAFRDELDILRWTREFKPSGSAAYGEGLLQNAVMFGVDYLVWLFFRGESSVAPETVQKQIMADAYFRGRMNRFHPLTSREAQLSHTFMATAFKVSQALSDGTPPDISQLVIKLRFRDQTESIDEVVKHEDVPLH
jgi:hypothetical protein